MQKGHKKTPFDASCFARSRKFGRPSAPVLYKNEVSHAANAKFPRQAGAFALPGHGNSRIPPVLEGSRHRVHSLRVHSHSHSGLGHGADKRGARKQASRMRCTKKACVGVSVLCVCLAHKFTVLRFVIFSADFFGVFTILSEQPCFFKHKCRIFALIPWIFP